MSAFNYANETYKVGTKLNMLKEKNSYICVKSEDGIEGIGGATTLRGLSITGIFFTTFTIFTIINMIFITKYILKRNVEVEVEVEPSSV